MRLSKKIQTLNIGNLVQLSKLYNFQDTVILAKIFEQRCNRLQGLFKSTLESVIRPALLAVVSTGIKLNA